MRAALWCVAALVLPATVFTVQSCGGEDSSEGYDPVGGADAAVPDSGGILDSGTVAWPDADPNPDAAPGPAPSFDAGAEAAAPFTCSGKSDIAGTEVVIVDSGGLLRSSLLHVPENYDPAFGTMLVLNFHGFSSANWQQAILTRMSAASDARGFLVAYPEGVVASWNAGDCCGTAWTDSVDDVQFIRDLLDKLQQDYCIDPRRIYATGMSNGGFFSHRLACDLTDRIAAIAPVAGVLGMPPEECHPNRPVSVLHFHGTEDPLVPYEGKTPIIPDLGGSRSVGETMDFWRQKNGCDAQPNVVYEHGDTICVDWPGCAAGTQTALCTINQGGHTWPGGVAIPLMGKTSQDIDATDAMLNFFEVHPMP